MQHRTGWLNPVFEGLSYAGRLGLLWVAIAVILCALWRRWGVLGLTIVAVALADSSATGLKAIVGRERPQLDPLVPVPETGSFPSGHAATSFAGATILSVAFPRLALPLLILALAVGFSRVYVGVHYPLDIVGGAFLGVLVATALRQLVRVLRRSLRARREG